MAATASRPWSVARLVGLASNPATAAADLRAFMGRFLVPDPEHEGHCLVDPEPSDAERLAIAAAIRRLYEHSPTKTLKALDHYGVYLLLSSEEWAALVMSMFDQEKGVAVFHSERNDDDEDSDDDTNDDAAFDAQFMVFGRLLRGIKGTAFQECQTRIFNECLEFVKEITEGDREDRGFILWTAAFAPSASAKSCLQVIALAYYLAAYTSNEANASWPSEPSIARLLKGCDHAALDIVAATAEHDRRVNKKGRFMQPSEEAVNEVCMKAFKRAQGQLGRFKDEKWDGLKDLVLTDMRDTRKRWFAA